VANYYFAPLSCVKQAFSALNIDVKFSAENAHIFDPANYTKVRGENAAISDVQKLILTGAYKTVNGSLPYKYAISLYRAETEMNHAIGEYKSTFNLISTIAGLPQAALEYFLFGESSGAPIPNINGQPFDSDDYLSAIGMLEKMFNAVDKALFERRNAEKAARTYLIALNSDWKYFIEDKDVKQSYISDLFFLQMVGTAKLGDYRIFVPEYLSSYENRIANIIQLNNLANIPAVTPPTDEEIDDFITNYVVHDIWSDYNGNKVFYKN